MKLASPKEMNAIDAYAINNLGIPGIKLMENAALRVVEEIRAVCGGNVAERKMLLLAGKGNNGGDAFAAARLMASMGSQVSVYVFAAKKDISGDTGTNLKRLEELGLQVPEVIGDRQVPSLLEAIAQADIIVDGIFGTGFKGKPEGVIKAAIEAVNSSGKPVTAIDIPSGVNGETGQVPGVCIKAALTVTFCLPKTGLAVHPGCEYTGRLVVADIGIPPEAVEKADIRLRIIDTGDVARLLPERKTDTSKGSYGRLLVVTGSTGMTGSGCLCANAAMRTGAGLVYVGVPAGLAHIYASKLTEPIIIPLEDAGNGSLSEGSGPQIVRAMEKMTVAAVGPGLSAGREIFKVIEDIIAESRLPMVLDADALNALSTDVSILKKLKAGAVITPHPGEMARLTGLSIREVQENRLKTAQEFAAAWGVVVVLKGARTVIALPDGTAFVNTRGNPGMATAGAGDVLAGVIASLIGQGLSLQDAAIAGVHIHSLAGDAAAEKKGMPGMIASDIIEELPYVIKRLNEK